MEEIARQFTGAHWRSQACNGPLGWLKPKRLIDWIEHGLTSKRTSPNEK